MLTSLAKSFTYLLSIPTVPNAPAVANIPNPINPALNFFCSSGDNALK